MAIQRINLGTAPSGTGGDTNRSAFTKIDSNFADSANAASRLVGTDTGNVMEVGAFGFGGAKAANGNGSISDSIDRNGIYSSGESWLWYGAYLHMQIDSTVALQIGTSVAGDSKSLQFRTKQNGKWNPVNNIYTDRNTTKDSNGFIKAASPIVKLFADKIELNDEAQQQKITFVKNGVGDYLIKGSTGFAQEGWYIEMPKDANGNVLVAVVYEQLANKDISVKTYAKMFDPDTGDIVANTAKPRDIPATRWIDLRLQELPKPDVTITPTDTTNAQ